MEPGADLLLVVPPGSSVRGPTLGPALLVTSCRLKGIDAYVHHANMQLAKRFTFAVYEQVATKHTHLLLNEVLFRPFVTDRPSYQFVCRNFFDTVSAKFGKQNRGPLNEEQLYSAFSNVAVFLSDWTEYIMKVRPRIVGFSAMFQQTLASAAMAEIVRKFLPESTIVIGGSNTAGVMGKAIAAQFSQFDYIFSGEADILFPNFCATVLFEDKAFNYTKIIECDPIENLNSMPVPDYSEYFVQLDCLKHENADYSALPDWLHFETSRGCWWGKKHHCTFCGLNSLEMAFRRKSTERTVEEIGFLHRKYGVERLHAVDNIMPIEFTREVLPTLASRHDGPKLFYEVKANLSEDDVSWLAQANVYAIQPGIESFSTAVLKLMKKGVTAGQNIELLRNALAQKIFVYWNIIFGFPGERKIDYINMLNIFPLITHLQPPETCGPIRVDRFSPYFERSAEFGISSVKPLPLYDVAFNGFSDVADLAYHFSGEYRSELLEDSDLVDRISALVAEWTQLWKKADVAPRLNLVRLGNAGGLIEDTRKIALDRFTGVTMRQLHWLASIRRHTNAHQAKSRDIESFLWAVERKYVALVDDQIVNLIVGRQELWRGDHRIEKVAMPWLAARCKI